ncbi:Aste57867_17859 [Aphanomyces stellatus]|uniref:Aste57867_17859 protein n=1 Tax=Aphanomyces stellatus TaxID=120398 RepID=A0A485LC98_9STRA|nr:hypothetical protein As57867_017798 [Aphanomyces stellatus]VFT94602.1 Aste57867_17859 [Aphanomyces stellatus]
MRVLKVCYYELRSTAITVYTRHPVLKWMSTDTHNRAERLGWVAQLAPWTLTFLSIGDGDRRLLPTALFNSTLAAPGTETDAAFERFKPTIKALPNPRPLMPAMPKFSATDSLVVATFDGSVTLSERVGSYGVVLWQLPNWDVIWAGHGVVTDATVNVAEYSGLLCVLRQAAALGIHALQVFGDSRLILHQVLDWINCKQEHLKPLHQEAKRLLRGFQYVGLHHVAREWNGAADHLAMTGMATRATRCVVDSSMHIQLHRLNKLPLLVQPTAPDVPNHFEIIMEVDSVLGGLCDQIASNALVDPLVATAMGPPALRSRLGTLVPCFFRHGGRSKDRVGSLAIEPIVTVSSARGKWLGDPHFFSEPQCLAFVGAHLEALEVERLRRISRAQDDEVKWADIKAVLHDHATHLPAERFRRALKVAWSFEIGQEDALYRVHWSRQRSFAHELRWALVVPQRLTAMVLTLCHGDPEGGHFKMDKTYERLKKDFYWTSMYADARNFVVCCEECNTGGPPPRVDAMTPGNLTPEYPMHIVGMDFAVELPKSNRGNTVLEVFLDWYTAFVMVKATPRRDASTTAQAFEEQVFRRFGACTQLRHDRDPAFMSEVFRAFNDMLGQTQMPTFAYRPQANGATERMIQTLIRSVKAYSTDSGNQDWDDHAERLVHAINTSVCSTRKETPFFLMHGWDPQTTLTATLPTMKTADARSAWRWRKDLQQQYLYSQGMASDIIAAAQKARADNHNTQLPQDIDDRIHVGDAVWLYIDQVKAHVKKKLAHLWHGPFRVLSKPYGYASELELKARSSGKNYRFHATVHDGRLKLRRKFAQRPVDRIDLPPDVGEFVDFDEELGLPDDSFVDQWHDPNVRRDVPLAAIRDVRPSFTTLGVRIDEYEVRFEGSNHWVWVPKRVLPASELLYEFDRGRKGFDRLANAIETEFDALSNDLGGIGEINVPMAEYEDEEETKDDHSGGN